MSVLILLEHDSQKINPAVRSLITAALQLGKPIHLLLVGNRLEALAQEAAELPKVDKLILVDDPQYAHLLAENIAPLLAELAPAYDYLLVQSSCFGKNCLPRAAALLDVEPIADVTKILAKDCFERPIYAGNAIERLRSLDAKKCLTIRATAFEPAIGSQPAVPIETKASSVRSIASQFCGQQLTESSRPELGQAKRVVAGGRALQSAENFKLIETLADSLGAAVAASRAAVDAGFVPNDYQVGQTGKMVAPDLYIAIGISGAIQHVAGMKDSKVIVAINKDPEAPIFQIANYGLVGDLFSLVPELIAGIKNLS